MQTIAIKCSDNAYAHILYLSKADMQDMQNPPKAKVDFSAFKIDSFKEIDPVKYQRRLRGEW